MGIPIFFVHRTDSEYLRFTLAQAHFTNPTSTVHLLGDASNKHYDFVEHHEIREFEDFEFRNRYLHLSPNSFEYELFCFERWFVLRNFVKAARIEGEFIYLDSDVMVFSDLSEESGYWTDFDLTVCGEMGPEYTYFKNVSVLESFCDFMLGMYGNDDTRKELQLEFDRYVASEGYIGGGICDMRLLARFKDAIASRVLDLDRVNERGGIFNHNINGSDGYLIDSIFNIKYIEKLGDEMFLVDEKSRRRVRLLAAHFQGLAKKHIPVMYQGPSLASLSSGRGDNPSAEGFEKNVRFRQALFSFPAIRRSSCIRAIRDAGAALRRTLHRS